MNETKDAEEADPINHSTKCHQRCPPNFWTIARKIFSTILTLSALGLIVHAIGMGYAALPGHWAVQYVILVCVIILLGYLEGLQV